MLFELFRGKGGSQVETIEAQTGEMFATTNGHSGWRSMP
jgi:hypothetical protein